MSKPASTMNVDLTNETKNRPVPPVSNSALSKPSSNNAEKPIYERTFERKHKEKIP
mgnify:CR=1 FL=1